MQASSTKLLSVVEEAHSRLGAESRTRHEAMLDWECVLSEVRYVPVHYLNSILSYQLEYQKAEWDSCSDFSCVLYSSGRAVAIWPLTLSWTHGRATLNSYGIPISPPLFVAHATPREIKVITAKCHDLLSWLANKHKIESWTSQEAVIGAEGASEWVTAARARQASCTLNFDLYINLTLQEKIIKGHMRKSYRSLISAGLKKWAPETIGPECQTSTWREVQELHRAVSGAVTRGQATWDLQLAQIHKEEAALVIVRSEEKILVAAALFTFSRTEANYSMGVYSREHSSEPLGHIIQHHAIAELRSRGLEWYRLGADSDETSTKIGSIAHFKRGFATHRIPVLNTTTTFVANTGAN